MEIVPEPSETELARWVQARLAKMGQAFADPEAVEETLALHRELWLSLYRIEMGEYPDIPDPGQRVDA
ncbi:MAG: hypothetical protein ACXW0F_06550 [Gaiellaceae bacterium]